jgi:hypothetical protein
MEAPCEGLVTADGNQLEGLCGSTAAVMQFKGHTKEPTVTAQVIDRSRMTPILGMDFWKPHMAVFNLKDNVITIETEEDDGNTTVEHIDCWSEERSRKANTAAVLQDQLVDIQKANTWAQQQTSTVSTVQADDIAQQEEHLQAQVKEVEQLMSKQVSTTCRSTEDIIIPAGHKLMRAVTATVDEPASNLHCTMVFEVIGTKQTIQIDPSEFEWKEDTVTKQTSQIDPGEFDWGTSTVTATSPALEHTSESDSDVEPDLISESETESDEESDEDTDSVCGQLSCYEDDEDRKKPTQDTQHKVKTKPTQEKQTENTGVSAVPPMIVRPNITQTASAYVQIAVSNESGTAPLVIRKGEALATLRQIKQVDVKYQPAAVITDATNRETVASTYHGDDKRGEA